MGLITDYKRKFKLSPQLRTANDTAIASNGIFYFDLDERFIPYDDIIMVNLNSDNDCTILINGQAIQPLPKGNRSNLNFKTVRQLAVRNDGSTSISADEILVTYRNTGHQGRDLIDKGSNALSGLANISLIKKFL